MVFQYTQPNFANALITYPHRLYIINKSEGATVIRSELIYTNNYDVLELNNLVSIR